MKLLALVVTLALAADPPDALPEGSPQADLSLPPPGPPPAPDAVDAITLRVSAALRCPVCQGLSVADSPSESAQGMKSRVRELVVEGYTDDQIRDYFVARYGEWVLLSPPLATNQLFWLVPGLVVAIGLAGIGTTALRWRRSDRAPEAVVTPSGAPDDYERRLLEEVEK